ncbi:neutral/alkaline non-lysosomal ceramidase N-terminal domain-containing protein [Speluncibacter jeojiensis]|uniref:Neutral ceramidase n=1 Tax=Speluncibacter jeojiensis TaxID=2710754 RepID=A0A9X4RC96_9ACTN|nr:neutral/alkaline non-lysosomal ceramidase N-terminal domain-containing protein [Rhodococcus sp. D2-41]MDG3013309.1 neutral/alkaline ceramidase [Corynebacteriales bacterium D3-21]
MSEHDHQQFRSTHVSRRRVLAGGVVVGAVAATGALFPGLSAALPAGGAAMLVGRGIGDSTGEPLGAGMNGYAVPAQSSAGLHLRQRARAFVFAQSPDGPRFAHVTVEIGLMFESIFQEVLRRLQARFPGVYHQGNVLLAATHTHSAPGGTDGHLLVDITTFGFRPATFESNVAGIVDAIERAHRDLAPSEVAMTRGQLDDAGVNRSPKAFDRDPAADKAPFPLKIDPNSVNLQITRGGKLVGVINWFATHGTSMPPTNLLSSSDNKGYAALRWERAAGVDYTSHASPALVTAFSQSTPGDVTPNLDRMPGTGPTDDAFANTRIIGERQYEAASRQVGVGARPIAGAIDVRWKYVDMSAVTVRSQYTGDGRTHHTTPAMLGAAFAASSQEDGGGMPELGLNEGERGGNPWVRKVNEVVVPDWLKREQAPKDILLPVGLVPGTVQQQLPFYLVRLGDTYLFACGFEPTVVAGLRLRRGLAATLGVPVEHVVVQGYTNSYGHYLTTPEEYENQDYEGGATVFGKWQLPAVQQIADELAVAMRSGKPVAPGRTDGDLTGKLPAAPVGNAFVDVAAPGTAYGQLLTPVADTVRRGGMARARFSGANPNNNLRRDDTYLTVERRDGDRWVRVADDSDWATKIYFDNAGPVTTTTITWDVPANTALGRYRVTYRGDSRTLDGRTTPFSGLSNEFTVTA